MGSASLGNVVAEQFRCSLPDGCVAGAPSGRGAPSSAPLVRFFQAEIDGVSDQRLAEATHQRLVDAFDSALRYLEALGNKLLPMLTSGVSAAPRRHSQLMSPVSTIKAARRPISASD